MKNSNNKRTTILIILLLGLLVVAYRFLFGTPAEEVSETNLIASQRVEAVLQEVENINFDTAIMNDSLFTSLKSIENPLILLPVGKKNPFSSVGSNF